MADQYRTSSTIEIVHKLKVNILINPYLFPIRTKPLIIQQKDVGVMNQDPARIRIFLQPNMALLYL